MNFINRIFRSNMVDCPRCLGKGKVDTADIKRLKKELFWNPGKCAYCNGIGKVPPDRIEKVSADFEYLTTDLSYWERNKVVNGNEAALKRGNEYKEIFEKFIQTVEHLYYIENKDPNEIADNFFNERQQYVYSEPERKEMVEYIKKVISSKLKS